MAFISAAEARSSFGLMAATPLDVAFEYLRIRFAFHLQNADETAFGARECVIDKDVIAGHVELEFHDRSATCGHGDGLYPFRWRALQIAQTVNAIEDFADDVER